MLCVLPPPLCCAPLDCRLRFVPLFSTAPPDEDDDEEEEEDNVGCGEPDGSTSVLARERSGAALGGAVSRS